MNLFEVKVSITDVTTLETKKQVYLVDAMSFTEAEAKAIEAATPYSAGGIEVLTVRKSRVEMLINKDDQIADKWYRGKVAFTTLDNDKEKTTYSAYFIKADDFKKAYDLLDKHFDGFVSDWEIAAITETQIFDLI